LGLEFTRANLETFFKVLELFITPSLSSGKADAPSPVPDFSSARACSLKRTSASRRTPEKLGIEVEIVKVA